MRHSPEYIPCDALCQRGTPFPTGASKLFFFYSQEHQKRLNPPASPTGVLGRIPASRLYPIGLNILKIYPNPNTTGIGFNYSTEQPSSPPQVQQLIRADYNINSNWRVYGRAERPA